MEYEKGVSDEQKETARVYWKRENARPRSCIFICSACGGKAYFIVGNHKRTPTKTIPYKFCPNCGVKMDETN